MTRPLTAEPNVRHEPSGSDLTGTLLDIQNLSIAYGSSDLSVNSVNLTVGAGEIVGLIGESGSGKSSVALAALGLLGRSATTTATKLDVCGTDVLTGSAAQLSTLRGGDVGMVFQDAMGALDPCMRIGAQVAEVVRRHRGLRGRACSAAVVDLLEQVGIPDPGLRAQQYPHQLSGGLRQRAAIAVALGGEPKLLLADEPTTALDVTVQAGILELFRSIRDRLDIGILLISHDIGVIAQTADRVAVMLRGEVVEHGPTEEILINPRSAYTRDLLRAVPKIEKSERDTASASTEGRTESPRVLFRLDAARRSYRSGGRVVHALHEVNLEVHQGEVLGVVGESGSGKSTLAKLLVRLEHPSSGRLSLDGVDFADMRGRRLRRFRRAVQMVFQHPAGSLNPRLRIATSVREPLAAAHVPSAQAAQRANEVLGEVGLPGDSGTRFPHEFSGGQKQRVAIARAIVGSPEIVVLDEPTSALDVSVQAQVLELLAEIQRNSDITYVLISHNLAVVRTISDRVVVMFAGRVVESGPAEQLFDRPMHWYTAALVAAVPSPDPRERRTAAATSRRDDAERSLTILNPERSCAFAPRCPRADDTCRQFLPALRNVEVDRLAACHHPIEPLPAAYAVPVVETRI